VGFAAGPAQTERRFPAKTGEFESDAKIALTACLLCGDLAFSSA